MRFEIEWKDSDGKYHIFKTNAIDYEDNKLIFIDEDRIRHSILTGYRIKVLSK